MYVLIISGFDLADIQFLIRVSEIIPQYGLNLMSHKISKSKHLKLKLFQFSLLGTRNMLCELASYTSICKVWCTRRVAFYGIGQTDQNVTVLVVNYRVRGRGKGYKRWQKEGEMLKRWFSESHRRTVKAGENEVLLHFYWQIIVPKKLTYVINPPFTFPPPPLVM